MKIEKKFNILSFVIVGIIVIFFFMLVIDTHRVNKNKEPVFIFQSITYDDGSEKYYGLFYVVFHLKTINENDPNQITYHWELTPWFVNIDQAREIVTSGSIE
ncbi:MAG: hypothetical protein WCQ80_02070 [Bacilli bacterium]